MRKPASAATYKQKREEGEPLGVDGITGIWQFHSIRKIRRGRKSFPLYCKRTAEGERSVGLPGIARKTGPNTC